MKRMIPAVLTAVVAAFLVVGPGAGAPAPKAADKPEGPPTDEQYKAAKSNLRHIALGVFNYESAHGHFPTNLTTKDGKPGLSWRVAIVPYLEKDGLKDFDFKMDEPWDSEHNRKQIEKMPDVYVPVRGKARKGETFLQMFAGNDTLLAPNGKKIKLLDATDGLSNTVMVAEAEKPVVWSKPEDLPFDGKEVPKLGGMFDGEFHLLFGDGVVRRIPPGIDPDVLIRAIGKSDGLTYNLGAAIERARRND